jgi:hypothetical protein
LKEIEPEFGIPVPLWLGWTNQAVGNFDPQIRKVSANASG